MTIAIAACYLCRMLVPITALAIGLLVIAAVRWNLRPAARRLRHLRRIERSRELARRCP